MYVILLQDIHTADNLLSVYDQRQHTHPHVDEG